MKTSMACCLYMKMMLSNSQKLGNHKQHVNHVSLTINMNVKVAVELYYIFSKILKFGYW